MRLQLPDTFHTKCFCTLRVRVCVHVCVCVRMGYVGVGGEEKGRQEWGILATSLQDGAQQEWHSV